MKIELKKENKKSAIVSMGTRISIDSRNVRSIDLLYLRYYLQNVLGRECDYVSLKAKKDYTENRDFFKNISEVDLNDYDEVWIYNATLNAFGGLIKLEAIQTFDKLCDFTGDIFYMLIDPKMPCQNIAQYIKSKMDSHNGKVPTAEKSLPLYDLNPSKIDKYTNEIWPRIITTFDGVNYEKYLALWREKTKKQLAKNPNHQVKLCDSNWCELPLAEYYAVNERVDLKTKNYDYSNKKYDLIYFGNNRNTGRNKLIKNLYDKDEFNVFIAGYDPEFKQAKTETSAYVDHDKLFPLICSSYATVVCGDDLHNGNIKSARFFESMLLDTVAFIHVSYDPERKYISNKELADFIYVKTPEDIQQRLNKIKNDESLYRKIVEAERKEIFDQFGKYKTTQNE